MMSEKEEQRIAAASEFYSPERVAGRRELARRAFWAEVETHYIIRCDSVVRDGTEGPERRPICGLPFGQIRDDIDSQLIFIYGDVPAKVRQMRGVEVLDAKRLDRDELLPCYADEPEGHNSQLYPRQAPLALYQFSIDADPLSLSAYWTELENGADAQALSGVLAGVGAHAARRCRYKFVNWTPPSADYGIQFSPAVASGGYYWGPALRIINATTMYSCRHDGTNAVILKETTAGGAVTLASVAQAGASHVDKLEISGSALSLFLDGSQTALLTANDSAISAAGEGGFRAYTAGTGPTADDWSGWLPALPGGMLLLTKGRR